MGNDTDNDVEPTQVWYGVASDQKMMLGWTLTFGKLSGL